MKTKGISIWWLILIIIILFWINHYFYPGALEEVMRELLGADWKEDCIKVEDSVGEMFISNHETFITITPSFEGIDGAMVITGIDFDLGD